MDSNPSTVTADSTALAVAEAYFEAWTRNDPSALDRVLGDDVVAHGPLGRLEGAATYRNSLARIFTITRRLELRHTAGSTASTS